VKGSKIKDGVGERMIAEVKRNWLWRRRLKREKSEKELIES